MLLLPLDLTLHGLKTLGMLGKVFSMGKQI